MLPLMWLLVYEDVPFSKAVRSGNGVSCTRSSPRVGTVSLCDPEYSFILLSEHQRAFCVCVWLWLLSLGAHAFPIKKEAVDVLIERRGPELSTEQTEQIWITRVCLSERNFCSSRRSQFGVKLYETAFAASYQRLKPCRDAPACELWLNHLTLLSAWLVEIFTSSESTFFLLVSWHKKLLSHL